MNSIVGKATLIDDRRVLSSIPVYCVFYHLVSRKSCMYEVSSTRSYPRFALSACETKRDDSCASVVLCGPITRSVRLTVITALGKEEVRLSRTRQMNNHSMVSVTLDI